MPAMPAPLGALGVAKLSPIKVLSSPMLLNFSIQMGIGASNEASPFENVKKIFKHVGLQSVTVTHGGQNNS